MLSDSFTISKTVLLINFLVPNPCLDTDIICRTVPNMTIFQNCYYVMEFKIIFLFVDLPTALYGIASHSLLLHSNTLGNILTKCITIVDKQFKIVKTFSKA